jgi:hypothetical protein
MPPDVARTCLPTPPSQSLLCPQLCYDRSKRLSADKVFLGARLGDQETALESNSHAAFCLCSTSVYKSSQRKSKAHQRLPRLLAFDVALRGFDVAESAWLLELWRRPERQRRSGPNNKSPGNPKRIALPRYCTSSGVMPDPGLSAFSACDKIRCRSASTVLACC